MADCVFSHRSPVRALGSLVGPPSASMLPCIIMSDTQATTETVTLPADKQPAVRVMPMPSDANVHGDVFGGWIMSQVDIAGSIPAVVRANGRVATIAVNSFVFKQPVYVGDLVSFYANVVKTGRTSITVDVEVYAQRGRAGKKDIVKVTEAQLTYVAVDANRKPKAIPDGPEVLSV